MSKGRVTRLRALVAPDEYVLITNPVNIQYLCGYSGSNGLLLSSPDVTYLFTDSRYEIQSAQECFDVEVRIVRADLLTEALKIVAEGKLTIEARHATVAQFEQITQAVPGLTVTSSSGLIEQLRVCKDSGEIELIAQACKISTAALEQIAQDLRPGMTEREIAMNLEHLMMQLGAQDKAFASIVATGSNTAIPHHQPTSRAVEKGDLIKIDFGAKVAGYHSDCTRVFVAGSPAAWQLELHETVRQCQEVTRESVRSEVSCAEVDTVARAFMDTHNIGHLFTHGLGHGVGLEIHEDPFFSRQSATTIEANTVVTVEPGAYIAEQGGVRIEDTVLVTEDGYLNLTNFTYDLVTIG